jgi:uridine kinase
MKKPNVPHPASSPLPLLAAKLDGRLVPLDAVPADAPPTEPVTAASPEGMDIYRRSASFILHMAVAELFGNCRLQVGHSIANGFYYDLLADVPVNAAMLQAIAARMRDIIARDLPFTRRRLDRSQALAFFADRAMADNRLLIEHSPLDSFPIYECGRFASIEMFPLAPSTGSVSAFELKTYSPGFVILFPDPGDFSVNVHLGLTRKLFEIYRESRSWGQILGVHNVGRLNQTVAAGQISELIKIAESLHEKKIARIADAVAERRFDLGAVRDRVRLVLIAGPSAAGKTTFTKRLAIQLQVNGIRPVSISMDNYFIDREKCPRDENGEYDFEALEVLDLDLFNRHLADLLAGREVAMPHFDFECGRRKSERSRLHLEDDQILLVEGIHGLNERLSQSVPASSKLKIYISALTQLTINDRSRIPTTDTRILRRMIRDNRYRNYSAAETLKRFPSIIRGERQHIFPFQENADIIFNSALVYELAVLKDLALPLLESVKAGHEAFIEAQRLIAFLSLFRPVTPDEIPPTSILREFLGGSSFSY